MHTDLAQSWNSGKGGAVETGGALQIVGQGGAVATVQKREQ